MRKALLVICLVPLLLSGCATKEQLWGEADPPVSAAALQTMQTREFTGSVEQVFKAIVGTFQGYGYIITSAELATGLVTGNSVSDPDYNNFTGLTKVQFVRVSAFVTAISQNRVRVRVSFAEHVEVRGAYGGGGERESMRTKPELYQEFFTKLEESIFLQKNL